MTIDIRCPLDALHEVPAPRLRARLGGDLGLHLDVCTRCTGCTMVDPHTLLCVPCEEDVDGMESDGDAEL